MYELKDVCVLIVLYNPDVEILSRIKRISKQVSHLLIVDNGSRDSKALEEIRLMDSSNMQLICNGVNKGIAYALNQGLDYASKNGIPLLLTMDQDSDIDIETIQKLANSIDDNQGVVSVGPFYDNRKHDVNRNVTYLITSGNMLHVQSIKKIGGFCEKLFIDCVDIDLSFNIYDNKLAMRKIAGTFMQHKIGEYETSYLLHIKYLSHSPKRFFFKIRNNIYIYKKYGRILPKLCLKLLCSCILEMIKVLLVERNKKVKLRYAIAGWKQGTGLTEWNNSV